ncbi:hypothetical protein C41B8_14140 [Salinisphaera hydrothermalis C41B8]|uniref:Uncharacterized protein n=1 Tax=Salinisphaera hydrothermalis (strain C41B8) TaxID=1304275 RepID=A0A084IIM8_SALHC|nr:hypothetical protein C41B8_14140 [Salinisphaera hydrothermalis C41B8]
MISVSQLPWGQLIDDEGHVPSAVLSVEWSCDWVSQLRYRDCNRIECRACQYRFDRQASPR